MTDLKKKKHETFDFSGPLHDAFGNPETTGVWMVWGNSGSGKTSFMLQLCMELSKHGRVVYNSLEEGTRKTLKDSIEKLGIEAPKSRFVFVREGMEEFDERLSKNRAPKIAVIDSFQYMDLSFEQYAAFRDRHSTKLLVFTSHADGKKPYGRPAKKVLYDADLKVWVEGYKAYSNGRYIGENGGEYTIWQAGHEQYYGKNNSQNEQDENED